LEDGSIWHGYSYGIEGKVEGEVVFNTGMVGYVESLTDPSYKGQILCQTYPLIGNYSFCKDFFESDGIKVEGYLVRELCALPSHYKSNKPLLKWLVKENIPYLEGIDTRELTKKLRVRGTMLGILCIGDYDIKELKKKARCIWDPNKEDLVRKVTIKEPVIYGDGKKRIAVIDCGVKMGIINSLLERGMQVLRVPATFTAERIMDLSPEAVLISNGPGDPRKADYVIKTAKELVEYKIPLMGICLGHQIIALALGMQTYKMKFGHRGQNHPVIMSNGRCFITSQNHGFAVKEERMKDIEILFKSLNDNSVEGIRHKKMPIIGVQFHPEARPGPNDTNFLFDEFLRWIR